MDKDLSCKNCRWLIEKKTGCFCEILSVRINAIDLDKIHIACTLERRKAGLQKHKIQPDKKYPRLESVFAALGYNIPARRKVTYETITINKHWDGTYKTQEELLQELRELRDQRASIIHPDKNPRTESDYCNDEMAKVNEAYERGLEIILNRKRDWRRKYKGRRLKKKVMKVIEAFTTA